jgi:NTP pyrophosphatase (non-canonical NTP hydrolase)
MEINSSNYVDLANRTAMTDYEKVRERLTDENIDLLHAGMGLCTETGEFMDMLKKHIFYGKELDRINLAEELGDDLWYVALAINRLKDKLQQLTLDSVLLTNIEKLQKRYPDKFTEDAAINRDTDAERIILEEMGVGSFEGVPLRLRIG